MILKASQRGGGIALAAHLLKAENEQVEVHEIRGFVADNLKGAMKEAQATALGTRCKQYLFSVSLNPPEWESVGIAAFESAIERIEAVNGLTGQPRMIVFHEKEGRRHAHAVWSRIDAQTMTARPLPFFKTKLRDVSKALYLEHGWQVPRGLIDSREQDPRNFDLAQWQQTKRMGRDPAELKATVHKCWAASDSAATFTNALEAWGLYLAKGDRRAHVAVTYEGEVVSIARLIGKRSKDVTAKLGGPDTLRSVSDTRQHIAETVAPRLKVLIQRLDAERREALMPQYARRDAMKDQHRAERQRLDEGQRVRFIAENNERASRLRTGVAGLWDRLTGAHSKTVKRNDAEGYARKRQIAVGRSPTMTRHLERRSSSSQTLVIFGVHHASMTNGRCSN